VTFPFGQTVQVFREDRNRFGDVTRVDERELDGVAIAPRVSNEGGGDLRTATVTTGLTMYAPPDHGLTAQHSVEVDGVVYRVQGSPGSWRSPLTDWAAGDQIELDRTEG
jgi:hypothetical protein